jgi:hypothetical protein
MPWVNGQNWFYGFLRTAGQGSELVLQFSENHWPWVRTGSMIF